MRRHDDYAPQSGDLTFDVESYDLDLTYRVRTNRLEGRALINAVAAVETRSVSLDLVGLRATRARIDGDPRTGMLQGPRKLRITPPRPLAAGEAFSIEVVYGGAPAPRRSRWGLIGWEELEDGALVAGQPIGAPTWFPCNDRPDDRARYRIAVTTDDGYAVAATGVPGPITRSRGRVRREFTVQTPMATYLAAVHVGRYQETMLGRARIVHPPAIAARCPAGVRRRTAHDGLLRGCLRSLPAGGVHDRRHLRRAGDPPRGAGTGGLRLESSGCRIRASDRP